MSKGSPSPKSPYVMARISPKSPYIMAAKSPKSPMLSEKYKSGCAWGLISIFNFRQDRSSKKLISDRRGLDRHKAGNRHTRNMHNALSGADEKCQVANDGPHNKLLLLEYAKEKNAKSFMDKDKSTEQKVRKSGCVRPESSSVGYVKKHSTESKPSCVCVNDRKDAAIVGHNHKQPSRQISVDELLHKLDSAATTTSFHSHHRHGKDNDFHKKDNDCLDSNQLIQGNDLAEVYVNQKLINGKFFRGGGPSSQSKQFLDALQILNSNKELFVKLLQDPNSLLVKHIEELRDAQATQVTHDAKLPENEVADASQPGKPIYTQKFRRKNMRDAILKKVKSRDNYPPRGVEDPQSSSEIVVLKPGPSNTQNCEDSYCSSLQSHYPETEEQSARLASLTLGGFRRKLRHAIGVSRKEQHQFSDSNRSYKTSSDCRSMEESDKGIGKVMAGKSSLNEIDSESVMKWKDKIGRTKSFGDIGLRNSRTVKHHKQSEHNVPTEAGKHDLEMPGNGNEGGKGLPEEGTPKTNDQTRFSESWPNSLRNPLSETKTHESICSYMDNVCSTGFQRIIAANDSISPEESNLLEVHSELNEADINTSNSCMDSESLELSKLDSPPPESVSSTSSLEVSSSALLSIQKVEGVNIKDGSDQPSPVSVLERFCIEDTSIPADIISQSAELPVQPQQISFDEQCSALLSLQLDCQRTLSTCINEHGSLTDYVRSVVRAGSLDWDELSLNCDSPDQLLEPSIYDEFGVSCSDHGLLFDCINEILIQVYQYYFRCSHAVSFMKPKIRPFSVEDHVVYEVVKCFDRYLLSQPPSQTLERLAETDLAKSMAWMDIHIHAEETVTDIAEAVLQELVMETVSQLQV